MDDETIRFLDSALATYGRNSAGYISFGTSAWPVNRPRLVELILESLLGLEDPLPFIFVKGSNAMPDGLEHRVNTSGRGLIVDWAPQIRVLNHAATGIFLVNPKFPWFLFYQLTDEGKTHAGGGSLIESVVAGVPVITLPFIADQPALSAFCASHLRRRLKLTMYRRRSDPAYWYSAAPAFLRTRRSHPRKRHSC